jgi:hypothetical protein
VTVLKITINFYEEEDFRVEKMVSYTYEISNLRCRINEILRDNGSILSSSYFMGRVTLLEIRLSTLCESS